MQLVDAHLRRLAQEDIGGVDVDDHIRALHVAQHLRRDIFRRRAGFRAGEHAVHIQIEHRDAARDLVDAERIEGGIDVHKAIEMLLLFVDPSV